MTISLLGSPQADAAAIAAATSFITAAVTAVLTARVQIKVAENKIAADIVLLERRVQGDLQLVNSKADVEAAAEEKNVFLNLQKV